MQYWQAQTHHKKSAPGRSILSARLIRDCLIGAGVAVALWTAGCSNLTVAPKPVQAQVIAFDENVQNAGIIDCDAKGCLTTKGWMQRYGKLEEEFRVSVPSDSAIKMEGNYYRVPFESMNHMASMMAAKRGGP
jgi:hypothetical protein